MRNGLPFSKPKVRLLGNSEEALPYLGGAYNLLFKVRQVCDASGAPVFALSRKLPDGTLITAAVVGNEEIVSCTPAIEADPPAESQRDDQPPRFYGYVVRPADDDHSSGWLPEGGASVDALLSVDRRYVSIARNTPLQAGGRDWKSEDGETLITFGHPDMPRRNTGVIPPAAYWVEGARVDVSDAGAPVAVVAAAVRSGRLLVAGYRGSDYSQMRVYVGGFTYSGSTVLTQIGGVYPYSPETFGAFSADGSKFVTMSVGADDAYIYEATISDIEDAPGVVASFVTHTRVGHGGIYCRRRFFNRNNTTELPPQAARVDRSLTVCFSDPSPECIDYTYADKYGAVDVGSLQMFELRGAQLLAVDYRGNTLVELVARPDVFSDATYIPGWPTMHQETSYTPFFLSDTTFSSTNAHTNIAPGTPATVRSRLLWGLAGEGLCDRSDTVVTLTAGTPVTVRVEAGGALYSTYEMDVHNSGTYTAAPWEPINPFDYLNPYGTAESRSRTAWVNVHSEPLVAFDLRYGLAVVLEQDGSVDPKTSTPGEISAGRTASQAVRLVVRRNGSDIRVVDLGAATIDPYPYVASGRPYSFRLWGYESLRYVGGTNSAAPYDYPAGSDVTPNLVEFPYPWEWGGSETSGSSVYSSYVVGDELRVAPSAFFVRMSQRGQLAVHDENNWLLSTRVNHATNGPAYVGLVSVAGSVRNAHTLFSEYSASFRINPVRVI